MEVLKHTGPLGLGEVLHRLNVKEKHRFRAKKDKNSETTDSFVKVVTFDSTVIGKSQDKPSFAEHKRKHRWT